MCTPEDIGTTEYPGEFHSRLSDKEVVFDLEKKYKSVVEFNDGENPEDPGEAIVKGTEFPTQNMVLKPNDHIMVFLATRVCRPT